jgi:DNA-binding transcriptional ArsR family regulator
VVHAIDLLGSPVRVAIVGSLIVDGPQTRGQLASRLELNPKTIQDHLTVLREAGAVHAVPLEDTVGDWHRTEYHANLDAVRALYATVGRALGVVDGPPVAPDPATNSPRANTASRYPPPHS